jgi:hypothetical protein
MLLVIFACVVGSTIYGVEAGRIFYVCMLLYLLDEEWRICITGRVKLKDWICYAYLKRIVAKGRGIVLASWMLWLVEELL